MLGFDNKYPACHPKAKFWLFAKIQMRMLKPWYVWLFTFFPRGYCSIETIESFVEHQRLICKITHCYVSMLYFIIFRSITSSSLIRGSRGLEVFCKKDDLKNFTKFTGKERRQGLFLTKLPAPGDIIA